MATARSKRTQQLFRQLKTVAFSEKKLFVMSLLSTLINAVLMYCIVDPIVHHEQTRIALGNVPVWETVWFYVLILAFFYIRNTVNCFFNAASIIAIKLHFNHEKKIIRPSISTCRQQAWVIWQWATCFSCLSVFFNIYSAISAHNSQRKLLGGSHYRLAAILTPTLIAHTGQRALKALAASGKLITQTWGKPPLQFGIGLMGLSMRYVFYAILPTMIGLVLFFSIQPIVYACVGLSAVMLFFICVIEKTLHQILLQVMYNYATQQKVPDPFCTADIQRILTRYIVLE